MMSSMTEILSEVGQRKPDSFFSVLFRALYRILGFPEEERKTSRRSSCSSISQSQSEQNQIPTRYPCSLRSGIICAAPESVSRYFAGSADRTISSKASMA